jgi:hypothetical protein
MDQTILFMLFMMGELIAILFLYQFIIIPRNALATNNLFEKRMMDRTWDVPAMLEEYTSHLLGNMDALLFGYTDEDGNKKKGKIQEVIPAVITGAFGKGMSEAKKDNPALGIMDEAMEELPWYAKALLLKATGGNPEGLLGALKGVSGDAPGVEQATINPKFGLK